MRNLSLLDDETHTRSPPSVALGIFKVVNTQFREDQEIITKRMRLINVRKTMVKEGRFLDIQLQNEHKTKTPKKRRAVGTVDDNTPDSILVSTTPRMSTRTSQTPQEKTTKVKSLILPILAAIKTPTDKAIKKICSSTSETFFKA